MSNVQDYTVGWICAISTERVAAEAFLDEEHEAPGFVSPNDNNDYTLGKIGKHNVVIAVLPDAEYGLYSAANVARDMLHSFPNVRIGLLVGIGGGAPSPRHDIRLGDVVVSSPSNGYGGVFQYDFGKTIQGQEFQETRFLNQPPTLLRTAVNGLRSQYERKGNQIEATINAILENNPRLRKKYQRPEPSYDQLFKANVIHDSACTTVCSNNLSDLMLRSNRAEDEDNPTIHYGLIASANQLMKDALIRDKLAAEKEVLCFEMEAAGLMNHFPCMVIRGICDYSDSHKNKEWQGYAAMTAAAYAKDLLHRIPLNQVEAEKKITDIVSGIQQTLGKILREKHDQEESDTILNWLTSMDYAPQHNDIFRKRHAGTGQWLLDSIEYQDWLKIDKKTLFCPGIPGTGKTILASVVINDLTMRFHNDQNIGLAYIYCDFRRQDGQNIYGLLRSLLKQLAQKKLSLPDQVKAIYENHASRPTEPSLEELSRALHSVAAMYSRIFVVVDALDELQEYSDNRRTRFLTEIFATQAKDGINIFATSRFIPEISDEFKNSTHCTSLEIRASEQDLRRYINGNMSRLPSFVRDDPALQEQIEIEVTQAVNGIFLLAKLHLDSLVGTRSRKAVRNALKKFGTGSDVYDSAYKEAMERIEGQMPGQVKSAKEVLSWITCTKRPLTTLELLHALAIEVDTCALDEENLGKIEDLVGVCAGLVIVDEESKIIRLIHYTTQQYFEKIQRSLFPNALSNITISCVTYLSFSVFESGFCQTNAEFEERLQSNPFYDYAAHYWGYHAREALESCQRVIEFLQCDSKVEASSQALMATKSCSYNKYDGQIVPRSVTGLHLASYFGIQNEAQYLLNDMDPDIRDSYYYTPLLYAAKKGHENVVKLLLEKGADIEACDSAGRTALLHATSFGHEAVTKLLLEKGANIKACDNLGDTPLSYAIRNKYEAVSKPLLEESISIEASSVFSSTLLPFIASCAYETMKKLLLETGVDINACGPTPFYYAVAYGHEFTVKLLRGKGTNIEDDYEVNHTLLWYAILSKNMVVVKLLLQKGVNIEDRDISGITPLWYAITARDESMVKLLLEEGANIEVHDESGLTPLWHAVTHGHEFMVKQLLEKGANTEVCDEPGHTPLIVAVSRGNEAIVELLLENGANTGVCIEPGYTPLVVAASRGNKAIVELLLQKGANIEAYREPGYTPLVVAATFGDKAIVELLLQNGANIEACHKPGYTPLAVAASYGYKAIVELLLQRGANIQVHDKDGHTPLCYAVVNNHKAIIKLLLEKGAKSGACDEPGHTSLL